MVTYDNNRQLSGATILVNENEYFLQRFGPSCSQNIHDWIVASSSSFLLFICPPAAYIVSTSGIKNNKIEVLTIIVARDRKLLGVLTLPPQG